MNLNKSLDLKILNWRKILKAWIPLIAGMALIYGLSSCPNMKTQFQCDYLLRRGIHIFEYFTLTFLFFRAFQDSFGLNFLSLFIYPVSLSLLFAVSDEIHQLYVLGRHGTTRDVGIDMIGIFGFYLFLKFRPSARLLPAVKNSQ